MTKQCPIVQDLLPSYIEQLCSNESKQFVETHLGECDECSQACFMMKEQITSPVMDNADDAQVLHSMHKTYKSIRVRTLLIAVMVAVFAFVGLSGLRNFLQGYYVPVTTSEADLFSIGQTPDGAVYYMFGSSQYKYNSYGWGMRINEEENALYYDLERSMLRKKRTAEEAEAEAERGNVVANPLGAHNMDTWMDNGHMYIDNGGVVEIKKLYIGNKDDYRLVWQEGDDIPVMPYDPEEGRAEEGKG